MRVRYFAGRDFIVVVVSEHIPGVGKGAEVCHTDVELGVLSAARDDDWDVYQDENQAQQGNNKIDSR